MRWFMVLVWIGAACNGDPAEPDHVPSKVIVMPPAVTLVVGDTATLAATVLNSRDQPIGGTGKWSTTDTSIARVDSAGLLAAFASGQVDVVYRVGGIAGTATVVVEEPPAGWHNVSTGCGVRDGSLQCWSWTPGGLGPPYELAQGSDYSRVFAGVGHSCALKADGAAFCWGSNSFGQLGDGTTTDRDNAAEVTGGLQFSTLAVGMLHTCGITDGGRAYCWGNDQFGQLGIGGATQSCSGHACTVAPAAVDLPGPVRQIAAGGHDRIGEGTTGLGATCAVIASGAAYCWGWNDFGMLGDGTFESRAYPTAVVGGHHFSALAVGGFHTCGATPAGELYCWGSNDEFQLGVSIDHTPTTTCYGGDVAWACSSAPLRVPLAQAAVQPSVGRSHSCVRLWYGGVQCWGHNGLGEIGRGQPPAAPENVREPVDILGGRTFLHIDATGAGTCGLSSAREAVCWGAQLPGQEVVPQS